MNCARVQQQIVDSLALRKVVEASAAAHLSDCPECRAFEEEQSLLFGSIDLALTAIANAPVPASLLPAVRSNIQASQKRPVALYGWLSAGVVAAVACAFLIARMPHVHPAPGATSTTASTATSATVTQALPKRDAVPLALRTHSRRVQKANHPDMVAEVLIDRTEAADLGRLADSVRRQPAWGQGLLRQAPLPPEEMKPLAAIEIAQLNVKPLTEEKW